MDFATLRSTTRLRAANPSTDGIWTDTYVGDAVNEALASISLEQPWPWLLASAVVTGDGEDLDLTSDFPTRPRQIRSVLVGTYEAREVSIADIDLWASLDSGSRYTWAAEGDTLYVRPEPDASVDLLVRYVKNEPVLVDDGDTPVMPAEYHHAIVHKASSICFEGLDDQSSAAMHEARARMLIDHMIAGALRTGRGPHRIRVRPGSGI